MIISEIELDNFRIYYGKNVLDLTPTAGKNMIVISGQNGFGKTTFLMSLVWCLYGRQMERVDEIYEQEIKDKRNYGNYISNSLNKTAKDNGKTKFSVSLTFTSFSEENCIKAKSIKIERSYNISDGQEELKILFDGKENRDWETLTKEEALKEKEYFIRENILALEAAKFFFFDAERIVSFANTNKAEQSNLLGESFAQVLGIQRYIDLKNQLEKIRDDYKKDAVSEDGQSEYLRATAEFDAADEKIASCKEEISNNEKARDLFKTTSDDLQSKIIKEGDVISEEELAKLRDEEEELKTKMSDTQNELKDIFNVLPFGICGGLLSDVIQQVESERAYQQYKLRTENVDELTYDILNDLEENLYKSNMYIDLRVRTFYQDQIKGLVKKYFCNSETDDFVDFDVIHDMTENQIKQLYSLVSNVKSSRSTFLTIYHKYDEAKSDLAAIRKKIVDAEQKGDSALLQRLRAEKADVDADYEASIAALVKGREELDRLKEEKKALAQKKEHLGKQIAISNINKKYDDVISRLIFRLDLFINEFKKNRIESLQDRITCKLHSFLHKKDLIKNVEMTMLKDGIDISLRDYRDKRIDQIDLSMGERQMLSSAILGSMVDETNTILPVFIDSPLQKFDTDHTESILTKFYPNVSEQVIIFPLLRKELTEDEYKLIKNLVAKAFIIENSSNGSGFHEIIPDQLFNYK